MQRDVVEAARQGKFHIYAVSTIDEGIEVLTGLPAGQRDENGAYPEGSVNHLVLKKLQEYTDRQKKFASAADRKSLD